MKRAMESKEKWDFSNKTAGILCIVFSIPAGVVDVGNPCRVLRTITEADEINERFIIR